MMGLFFAQLIKHYGHFLWFGVEIALSHRHVEKTLDFLQQSTASMRTSRLLPNQHTGVAAQMMC